jgi:hypothetical protein
MSLKLLLAIAALLAFAFAMSLPSLSERTIRLAYR